MIQKIPRPNAKTDKNYAFISLTNLLQHVFAFDIERQSILLTVYLN